MSAAASRKDVALRRVDFRHEVPIRPAALEPFQLGKQRLFDSAHGSWPTRTSRPAWLPAPPSPPDPATFFSGDQRGYTKYPASP